MKIPDETIRELYVVAKHVYEGALTKAAGVDELHRRFALNRNSARDYINNVAYMLTGQSYVRTNNAFATRHFLEMIYRDFGLARLKNAISAVGKHLDYYEALPTGSKQPEIRRILQDYVNIANDESAEEGHKQLFAHQEHQLDESGAFDPTNDTDARERTISAIVIRYGQPAFRRRLINLYDGRCAISDCQVEAALEAAHVLPYRGRNTNQPSNGLLLRADLHTLFDLGLIAVDSATMTVRIAPELEGTCYQVYAGKKLRLPSDPASHPDCEALDKHRKRWSKT